MPNYQIYFQKQPGTDRDPLEFTFNLPAYLEVKNVIGSCHPELVSGSDCRDYDGQQNITISTDLVTDRHFEIELKKK